MRALFCFSITLLTLGVATANPTKTTLPPEVHPSFAQTLNNAEDAYRQGEVHKALAMLKGIVYPNGVTIKLDANSTGSKTEKVNSALKRSIHTWQRKLDGASPIQLVGPTREADITVVLTDKIPASTHDALGLIDLKKEYRWNQSRHEVSNKGTIYVMRNWVGQELTEVQMTEVLTHELGHLLGLADVDTAGPLMGPMVMGKYVLEPQPHELRAVQRLRAEATSLIREYSLAAQFSAASNGMNSLTNLLNAPQTSYSHRIEFCTHTEHKH